MLRISKKKKVGKSGCEMDALAIIPSSMTDSSQPLQLRRSGDSAYVFGSFHFGLALRTRSTLSSIKFTVLGEYALDSTLPSKASQGRIAVCERPTNKAAVLHLRGFDLLKSISEHRANLGGPSCQDKPCAPQVSRRHTVSSTSIYRPCLNACRALRVCQRACVPTWTPVHARFLAVTTERWLCSCLARPYRVPADRLMANCKELPTPWMDFLYIPTTIRAHRSSLDDAVAPAATWPGSLQRRPLRPHGSDHT